jgi:solute carrier family 19 (thiamine transporter), member 2/3
MSDGRLTETFTHNRISNAFHLIWDHFKTSYRNKTVILWSLYYAIALCLYVQITAYIQVLWISIDKSQETIYNGAVEAILTLLGALFSLLAGVVHLNFLRKQNQTLIVLVIMSSIQGIFVVLAANSQTLMTCYIFYISYGIAYAFCITICATEIAKNLSDDAYGLVFGINTLLALIVQTSLTLSIVANGLLSPADQYQVYGYFYISLGGVYLAYLTINIVQRKL